MNIAVDIDGVLFDLIVSFCEIFNERYNTHYTKKDVINWQFFNEWNISEEEFYEILFEIYGNTRETPFIDKNAPKFMRNLNNSHDVYILSARASQYKSHIIENLKSHNIKRNVQYKELILVQDKPYNQKQNYNFNLYIDDNPHLAESIKNMKNRYLLLYNQPWNQNFICKNNIVRVHNWTEVYTIINSEFLNI